MRKAIFPGSFDPFTIGHWDIAQRALTMIDKLYIAVGFNVNKRGLLTTEARQQLIRDSFKGDSRVEVLAYDDLTVDLCSRLDVNLLVHGVRSFADFEYERQIAEVNAQINPNIENIFLLAAPGFASVSSSAIRELLHHNANVKSFLPPDIDIKNYL